MIERELERELIQAVQMNGCLRSFQMLIKELNLYQQVFCFAQRYAKQGLDLEEIAQETLVRAFSNIQRFDPEKGRFRSWVFGIATHQIYDWMRQRKRHHIGEGWEPVLPQKSPEELVGVMQSEKVFIEAIEGLKDKYRRVLVFFYVEGMSQEEIAKQEGLSCNNVGTILNRARKQVSKSYKIRINSKSPRQRKQLSEETLSFVDIMPALTQRFASV